MGESRIGINDFFFFFQAEDGIRDHCVTGVQTCALPILSVEAAIQAVAGITGFLVYVDYQKNLRYISPSQASSAPFSVSDQPNFINSFPGAITDFMVDDNSAINRVSFYGGTKISNPFPQDISAFANGSNKTFPLAYAPAALAGGGYLLTVAGVSHVVNTTTAAGATDALKSAGGVNEP